MLEEDLVGLVARSSPAELGSGRVYGLARRKRIAKMMDCRRGFAGRRRSVGEVAVLEGTAVYRLACALLLFVLMVRAL